MTETLFIRLPEQTDAPAQWLFADATGTPSGRVQQGALSDAAPLAAGRRVVVIVPGVNALLTEPELPVKGGARLSQIVPFALEEQLTEDLEDLHFAIGRREGERPGTPVAVINRAYMDGWVASLRAAQIEPQAVYVDCSLLPQNPSQTVLLIEEHRLHVRHPDKPPFVLDVEPLTEALDIAGLSRPAESAPLVTSADDTQDLADPTTEARHVIVYLSEADWDQHQATLEVAREYFASLNVQLLRDGALSLFARQAATQPPINLLQGPYAPRRQVGQGWQRWRVAAILFACLIGLNLVGKGIELWRLKKTERTLNAAIEQTFREAMPGEQNSMNARRRMETRLAAIRGGGDAGGILPMLNAVSTAFVQVPNARLDAFSFRNSVLDMKIAANDVGSLSQVESLVNQGGLQAQLQSSNANGSSVEGRVQVKGGSAR